MVMEVEILSRELVKPSSPTPNHLRYHRLSYSDQIQGRFYIPCIYFYSKETNAGNIDIYSTAKNSLSQALTMFYPLAGRFKNNTYIDCNDEGLLVVEARAKCQLKEILMNPNATDNNKLIPLQHSDVSEGFAAFLQITFFQCGGLAFSFALLHKVGDGISHITFVKTWAAIARGDTKNIKIPRFSSATHFPADNPSGFELQMVYAEENIVKKVFLFEASAIAAIRGKYSDKRNGISIRPSRTEALTAFIWGRFIAATQVIKNINVKMYPVLIVKNMRPNMDPPLSELDFGNFLDMAIAVANTNAAAEDGGCEIVSRIRESVRSGNMESYQKGEFHVKFMKEAEKWSIGEFEGLAFSSICNFGVYEVDFGWGKPVWIGLSNPFHKGVVEFSDTKDGDGIKVWISLKEEDMAKFEGDKQILAHISSTPFFQSNPHSKL